MKPTKATAKTKPSAPTKPKTKPTPPPAAPVAKSKPNPKTAPAALTPTPPKPSGSSTVKAAPKPAPLPPPASTSTSEVITKSARPNSKGSSPTKVPKPASVTATPLAQAKSITTKASTQASKTTKATSTVKVKPTPPKDTAPIKSSIISPEPGPITSRPAPKAKKKSAPPTAEFKPKATRKKSSKATLPSTTIPVPSLAPSLPPSPPQPSTPTPIPTPTSKVAPLPSPTAEIPSSVKTKPPAARVVELPAILFENDPPPAVAPTPAAPKAAEEPQPTPIPAVLAAPTPPALADLLGSGKLLLAPQNPHSILAYCDVAGSFLDQSRSRALNRILLIRIRATSQPDSVIAEIPLPLGSTAVFVSVPTPGLHYRAELGFYEASNPSAWSSLLESETAQTPPLPSTDLKPEDPRFGDVLYLIQSSIEKHIPLVEVVQQLHVAGQLTRSELSKLAESPWPDDQAALLRDLDAAAASWERPTSPGLLRPLPTPTEPTPEQTAANRKKRARTSSPSPLASSPASPQSGPASPERSFWFNVNVELVVYGSTEPNAVVTLGGSPIKLKPDGTFSARYSLPDGAFNLGATAAPPDGSDFRAVDLHFSRATAKTQGVGNHPQDPALQPPG